MKKLIIGLSCAALMFVSVAEQAEAFKFGPRLGFYSESFNDGACYKENEFGLQAALSFNSHPKKICRQGRCGQPVAQPQPRPAVMPMPYMPQVQYIQQAQPILQRVQYVQPAVTATPQVQIIQQR